MDPSATKLLELLMKLRREGIHDARVLSAMERVPREQFVPESYRHLAYADQTLPIGCGQTISQPLIVAQMTQALALTPRCRVLEIGTGSGYQAAVLASLCRRVATIERHKPLFDFAKAQFAALELYNVDTRCGDGFQGWPETAPFDAIIVTCAPEALPDALFAQLAIGGRLVAPVGHQGARQDLKLFTKRDSHRLTARLLGTAEFVPMVSGA